VQVAAAALVVRRGGEGPHRPRPLVFCHWSSAAMARRSPSAHTSRCLLSISHTRTSLRVTCCALSAGKCITASSMVYPCGTPSISSSACSRDAVRCQHAHSLDPSTCSYQGASGAVACDHASVRLAAGLRTPNAPTAPHCL
jgi:hypothetical protein